MAQTRGDDSSPLETHLGYWLRRVSNRVSAEFARALQSRGVSVAEWVALSEIGQRAETRPAELADALGMTRGAISKVLDKLEARDWIARRELAEDHRVQLLSLTRQGRRALPQLAEIADRNDARFFDCLDAGERVELRRLLAKLSEFHHIHDIPVE
jgi:DNA-binding MarR family transcriptional regulator